MKKPIPVIAVKPFEWQGRSRAAGEAFEVPVLEALTLKQRRLVRFRGRAEPPPPVSIAVPPGREDLRGPHLTISQAPGEPPALEPAAVEAEPLEEVPPAPKPRRAYRKRAEPDPDEA